MTTKHNDAFAQALDRLFRVWDRLALAVSEIYPDMPEEERDKLTREGMRLVLKGLQSPQVH